MVTANINRHPSFKNLEGLRSGRLKVISYAGRNIRWQSLWNCICECGHQIIALGYNLSNGNTQSCGCWNDAVRASHRSHGQTRHGRQTGEYRSWLGAKRRCFNPKAHNFKYYGGRGITMCDRWKNSFEAFFKDMGPRPPGTSIDRIDTNGHYEPGNAKWSTPTEQARNRRKQSN